MAPRLGRNPALNLAVLATHLVRAVILRLKIPDACCCHDAYTALLYRCRYYVHEDYHTWRDPLSALLRKAIHLYAEKPNLQPKPPRPAARRRLLDPAPRPAAPTPPNDDVITVGYHGRVEPVKRLHLVLDAIAHLRQEGHKAELVIMGDGPALPHLLQRAKNRGTP